MGIATVTGHEGEMVKLDEGGGVPAVALLAASSGEDSPPAIGDSVVVVNAGGGRVIVATVDNFNAAAASPGEVRRYSRNALGMVMAVLHLRADGSVAIEAPGGLVLTGDMAISGDLEVDGSITATEVTAGATPSTAVSLSTHTHPAPGGTTSPPTPGT